MLGRKNNSSLEYIDQQKLPGAKLNVVKEIFLQDLVCMNNKTIFVHI
jgi:hypothetical protein